MIERLKSTLKIQQYRVRGWVEEAAWRVRETHEELSTPKKSVLYILTLLLVLSPLLLLTGSEDPVKEEMAALSELVESDLVRATENLPRGTVRNLVRYEDDTLEGTIAKVGRRGQCIGFEVHVGAGYVLRGEQSAVKVSETKELPADDCVLKEGPVELGELD